MENMIKKIVEADDEAKALEKEILDEKEQLNGEIEKETKRIYDEYMSKAHKTAKLNDEQQESEVENQLEEIREKQLSVMAKLEADFEQNRGKWVDEIVSRAIS